MVWLAPQPCSSGGRSAESSSSGTLARSASSTAGSQLAGALPEVATTIAGQPSALASPRAKKAALRAATRPADGNTLYFVAVGDGSGRHVFSASLGEHNAAVQEYVQRYRAQRQAERGQAATQ